MNTPESNRQHGQHGQDEPDGPTAPRSLAIGPHATLYCDDCLAGMRREIADDSVGLIVADPPYHGVKRNEAWDRQWKTDADYLEWIGRLCEQWRRVLRPNGSLYVFASPRMAARVEVEVGKRFNVLNSITWANASSRAEKGVKEELRRWLPSSERIIFAEHHGADGFSPTGDAVAADRVRDYLVVERRRARVRIESINAALGFSTNGGMAYHYFKLPSSRQWQFPTKQNYEAMQRLFNESGGEYLTRDYDDLCREYESLRRPFAVDSSVPYTDVWDFPTVKPYPGKHPCEKPEELLTHIISTSSRPGDTVLDSFLGSGVTGVAALQLGRRFIGFEQDPGYFNRAVRRIERAAEMAGMATAEARVEVVASASQAGREVGNGAGNGTIPPAAWHPSRQRRVRQARQAVQPLLF